LLFFLPGVLACISEPRGKQPERVDVAPEALVRALSDYLGELRSFRCDLAATTALSGEGIDVELTTQYLLALDRPKRFAIRMEKGTFGGTIVSDGTKVCTYLPMLNQYSVAETDEQSQVLVDEERAASVMMLGGTGLLMLKALLRADPYEAIMLDVKDVRYLGKESIDGERCHHLEFVCHELGWEMWVSSGERDVRRGTGRR